MRKILKFLPAPVVQGMIAGWFMSYGLYIVNPLAKEPLVVFLMVAAYLVATKFSRRIPGVLASLIVAVVYYAVVGLKLPPFEIVARAPRFVLPAFTSSFPKLFVSLTIPLTALVLGAENAQAYGVLETEEYDPPVNGMTLVSGIGGIVSAFTGNINTNIAGPVTAICASPDNGKKEGRWTALIVEGIGLLAIAPIYASLVTGLTKFPTTFVYLITGLSVLGVLVGALRGTFQDERHRISGAFAFLVAASRSRCSGSALRSGPC
jgi:benzoate membrane transport protein